MLKDNNDSDGYFFLILIRLLKFILNNVYMKIKKKNNKIYIIKNKKFVKLLYKKYFELNLKKYKLIKLNEFINRQKLYSKNLFSFFMAVSNRFYF